MRSNVFQEDCQLVMSRYPDGYFDLAICDVPYGINLGKMAFLKEKKTTVVQKNGNRLNPRSRKSGYQSKPWDSATPDQSYFDELRRISKHQIIFGVEYVDWKGLGSGRVKWNKGVSEGMSFKDHEMAFCSLTSETIEIDILWSGMQQAKSLAEPMTQQGNKKLNEKRIHPCHKPILLYDKLYLEFGFPGMKVIDTHLGGGSNRISADKFGVSEFIACEIDPDYLSLHQKRWNDYKSQMKLQFATH